MKKQKGVMKHRVCCMTLPTECILVTLLLSHPFTSRSLCRFSWDV